MSSRKVQRQRANTTHGYGSMKKNRGAGNKGGKGNAGSGKRGDSKKPVFWSNKKKFGMYGFTSKSRNVVVGVNVSELATLAEGKKVDLAKHKINKLLGAGVVTEAYEVTVENATQRAIEKIEAAKGKVIVLSDNATADAASEE